MAEDSSPSLSLSPSLSGTYNDSPESGTSITDLNLDSLMHCTNDLTIQDISNLAVTCKSLRTAAYSDPIWLRLFREKWPEQFLVHNAPGVQVRESYLNRHTAIQQFNFSDPLLVDYYADGRPFGHVLLGKSNVFFSQGPLLRSLKIADLIHGTPVALDLKGHKASITSMRLFPVNEVRTKTEEDENLLITSSADHCIRLWWKDSSVRCLRGHSGPVSTLSDKLLGDPGEQVLASGGEDGTVRLWSLSPSGKRGKHALIATLHGHDKPIKLLSVSGHKTSLLVSVAMDSKIKAWDSTLGYTSRMSNCVGTTSVSGAPFGIHCFESMLYVAAGSFVHAIDLRTMKKAFMAAGGRSNLSSFEMLPSRSLVCTASNNRALLWDIRKSQDGPKPEPMAVLEGHKGPVTQIHMDEYKIVTSGPRSYYSNVWEVETGAPRTSLVSCDPQISHGRTGCLSMAVCGHRMVSVSSKDGLVRFRDFSNAYCPVDSYKNVVASRFWHSTTSGDSDYDSESESESDSDADGVPQLY